MSWNTVKLGDIFDISSSKRVHQHEWRKEGIPFYRAREIVSLANDGYVNNDLFIDESLYEEYSRKYGVPKAGDLLVSAVGTLGRTYAVKKSDKFYFKDASVLWLKKTAAVDTTYIQYAIKSDSVQGYIQNYSGATVGTYTVRKAKNTEIPLPPLPIQKQIAALLEKADTLRSQCKQMEQELNQLAQSVFLEMFGDPVTNPRGWKFYPISSLVCQPLQNGAYYEKELYNDKGIEMAHMSDTFYGVVERGNIKRVLAPPKDIEKYALTKDDVLVTRRSLVYEGAAKPCMIPDSEEALIYESSMIRVRPDLKKVLPTYLYHYLNNQRAREKYLFQYVTRSTISGINQTNLAKVEIMVPDIEIQKKFCRILRSINKNKQKLQQELSNYETLFNSLMQRAFKGELNMPIGDAA
ncbi:MAG: restriction endonuclease subunit S [Candidatus Thiodiazotropha sp. (ex Ctena orbiculata)]|nr:restriction endonuclease subunit S [Candidatus Thiodiazotropha taylori]